jgi:hypothetical protein
MKDQPSITQWINYEIRFNSLEEKVGFLLHLERAIRKWKEDKLISSFHVKHHHDLRVIRVRFLHGSSASNKIRSDLLGCIAQFEGGILRPRSREISKVDEDMSPHDHVRWKILEYNTEILFAIISVHGADYHKQVKEKYWAEDFDIVHMLLNQLGLPESDNLNELVGILQRFYGMKF